MAAIPANGLRVSVGGLQITEDGDIELIKVEEFEDERITVSHVNYDNRGTEISRNDLTDIIKPVEGFVRIDQVVFSDDGNIAVLVNGAGPENTLYLLDSDGKLLGQISLDFRENIAKMRDGRVVVSQYDGHTSQSDTTTLRVIDFSTVEMEERIPIITPRAYQLLSAGINQPYDLLLSDGRFVYGYTLENKTLTPLLDWMEVGITTTYSHHIGVLPDDRVVILSTEHVPIDEDNEWYTDFYLLTRISRAELPEKIILTIDGFWACELVNQMVIAFNQENPYYQIKILKESTLVDVGAVTDRVRFEMMVGRGPDIFVEFSWLPIGAAAYTDLYQFIDADPILNRTDFFPSVLDLLETRDGELPYLPTDFSVSTDIALRETANRIGLYTYTNLFRMLDEPDVVSIYNKKDGYIVGIDGINYYSFIDFEANKAHFNSEEFISWLEMTAKMPLYYSYDEYFSGTSRLPGEDIINMRNGEQLLAGFLMDDPGIFRLYRALIGDIVAVGIPTRTGGQYEVGFQNGRFGINANSPHKEAAWDFLRRFFLPDAPVSRFTQLSIRIDKYEEHIAELMTPKIVDGVEIPSSATIWGMDASDYFGMDIEVYAMTEEEAAAVREIIDNASLVVDGNNEVIQQIFNEATIPFFKGIRNAAETAQIIQNRVQRYLDERG